jgi:hypothetical protein
MMRFTDATGRWQAVRSDMPLPVAGGQVLQWLSDDFATLNTDIWEVSGTPSVGSSELTLSAGQALLSRQAFQPPCLVEIGLHHDRSCQRRRLPHRFLHRR